MAHPVFHRAYFADYATSCSCVLIEKSAGLESAHETYYHYHLRKQTEYLGIANFEEELTNEQLQYLHQYYSTNKYAGFKQILEITKRWNINNFDFLIDLLNWFYDRHMTDTALVYRRYEACRTAA